MTYERKVVEVKLKKFEDREDMKAAILAHTNYRLISVFPLADTWTYCLVFEKELFEKES